MNNYCGDEEDRPTNPRSIQGETHCPVDRVMPHRALVSIVQTLPSEQVTGRFIRHRDLFDVRSDRRCALPTICPREVAPVDSAR